MITDSGTTLLPGWTTATRSPHDAARPWTTRFFDVRPCPLRGELGYLPGNHQVVGRHGLSPNGKGWLPVSSNWFKSCEKA